MLSEELTGNASGYMGSPWDAPLWEVSWGSPGDQSEGRPQTGYLIPAHAGEGDGLGCDCPAAAVVVAAGERWRVVY